MAGAFGGLDLDKLSLSAGKQKRQGPVGRKSNFQEKRRSDALLRQQQARQEKADQARQLALDKYESNCTADEADADMDGQGKFDTKEQGERRAYSQQLLQPEWMVDIPADLYTEWFVMPRPEGQRCLVIASQGQTISRLRSGMRLHQFPSILPGGSRSTQSGPDDFSILDCIFSERNSTYYILDVMCWKGYSLYDCSSEFRLFWRDSKVKDDLEEGDSRTSRYKFVPVPAYRSDPDGLRAAHSGQVEFQRDGCYFCHKECRYDPEGPTPLALFWKDPQCSQFFIDTDSRGTVSHYQHVVLQVLENGLIGTGDEPPIPLGNVPSSLAEKQPRPGKLLKFSIRDGGIQLQEGEPTHVDLHFEGTGNQRRGRVDIWSKILFQHMARTKPLLFSDLVGGADEAMDL